MESKNYTLVPFYASNQPFTTNTGGVIWYTPYSAVYLQLHIHVHVHMYTVHVHMYTVHVHVGCQSSKTMNTKPILGLI